MKRHAVCMLLLCPVSPTSLNFSTTNLPLRQWKRHGAHNDRVLYKQLRASYLSSLLQSHSAQATSHLFNHTPLKLTIPFALPLTCLCYHERTSQDLRTTVAEGAEDIELLPKEIGNADLSAAATVARLCCRRSTRLLLLKATDIITTIWRSLHACS